MSRKTKITGALGVIAIVGVAALVPATFGGPATPPSPVGDRVSALAKSQLSATDAEIEELAEAHAAIAESDRSSAAFELDLDAAKVLVDNENHGRWVVIPATSGGGYCMKVSLPARLVANHGTVGCAPEFDRSGYNLGVVSSSDLPGDVLFGVVDDSVDSVSFKDAAGNVRSASVSGNVFMLEATGRGQATPVEFIAQKGSSAASLELR